MNQPTTAFPDDPIKRIAVLLAEIDTPGLSTEDSERLAKRVEKDLSGLHEADIADLLESLPKPHRQMVWRMLDESLLGGILLEVSDGLCEYLIEQTPTTQMVAVLQEMSADDVASLLRELPKNDAARLMRLAGLIDDADVRASLSFKDDTAGALMDFQPVLARETDRVDAIRGQLQQMGELPSHCDKLFIVDDWERLAGVLPLKRLLLNLPELEARDIMVSENVHAFTPDTDIETIANAFERYDLITAPVIDDKHKIVGRVTIDELFDHLHSERSRGLLKSAGVSEEEDLFASVPVRFANRGRWLFVNLIVAFFVSRVVGLFEGAIGSFVALAVLMPIVAGMSGNIGNQTATLTVRALALRQINTANWRTVMYNESVLSLVNGLFWGSAVGGFSYLLYQRWDLAIVLIVSMTLCFLASALTGFSVPIFMQRLGKDPALGTTVVVSALIDTLGFFVFLGLGSLFLI